MAKQYRLKIGEKYYPKYKDFATGRVIKSRKRWTYQGTTRGGPLNAKLYIFSTPSTTKYIPEYLFRGAIKC